MSFSKMIETKLYFNNLQFDKFNEFFSEVESVESSPRLLHVEAVNRSRHRTFNFVGSVPKSSEVGIQIMDPSSIRS